jgi:hypothetical protein
VIATVTFAVYPAPSVITGAVIRRAIAEAATLSHVINVGTAGATAFNLR